MTRRYANFLVPAVAVFLFLVPSLVTGAVWLDAILKSPVALQRDAIAFWVTGRHLAAGGGLAEIYDFPRFLPMERALFHDLPIAFRCPYPPPGMLMFLPMGWFDFYTAAVGWVVAGFLALLAAGWVVSGRGRRWWAMLLMLSPVTFINAFFEQTGALMAASAAAGLMLVTRWPVVGGGLIGLLIMKPQYAPLPGVALLVSRSWRAVAAAMATAGTLTLVAAALWGWGAWPAWLAQMPAMIKLYLSPTGPEALGVTPSFALHFLGVPEAVVGAVQTLTTVGMVALVAVVVRWRGFDRAAVGLILAAMTVATPYALFYDLTFVAAAVVVILADKGFSGLRAGEPTLFGAAWIGPLFPMAMLMGKWNETWDAPAMATLCFLLVLVLARRALAATEKR